MIVPVQSSMSDIKQNIPSVPMLSKIGKHISQRITGLCRGKSRRLQGSSEEACLSPRQVDQSPLKTTYLNTVERIKNMRQLDSKPSVGHYKVKYSAIDKNNQRINFKKLIPHFARDKPSSNFTQTEYSDPPNKVSHRVTGMSEFSRMTSRQEIKGSIRKTGENPHEKRFEVPSRSPWLNDEALARTVSFEKMLKRKIDMFRSREFSPDYNPNCEFGKKRLVVSVIPFEKQTERDQLFMIDPNSSELRDSSPPSQSLGRTIKFQKFLARYQQDSLPSYLDTGINNRLSLNEHNWKTLKMNCYQSKPESFHALH